MESVDLSIDTDNELNFMVTVEGSRPGTSSCRFLIEGPDMSYTFPGEIDQTGEVCVTIPSMDKILREGNYRSMLEVFVDDRVFIPLELDINFEKSVRVTAEAVVRKKKEKPKASAVLVNRPVVKEEKTLAPPTVEKKASKPEKIQNPASSSPTLEAKHKKQVSIGDLSEEELRKIIRETFLRKEK